MRSAFMLIPIAFVAVTIIAIVVLTLGVRGRPVFASPRCRRCGYDLRNMQFMSDSIDNCPECGAALSAPDGVSFGRWQRRPRQIVLGVALLALPWVAMLPISYFVRRAQGPAAGPAAVAGQPTPALLASLPGNMTTPWAWRELEQRLTAGTVTSADVDAAFAALAAHFNAERAAGKPRQPPHWFGNFIAAAITSRRASQPAIDALGQAYYGQAPPFTLRRMARAGEPVPLILNDHEPWDLNGLRRVWAITSIASADGTKLTPHERYGTKKPLPPDALSGTGREGQLQATLAHALPPGEHELTLSFEVGLVPDNATFIGLDGKPGTPDKWPAPVSRWKTDVKRKITVVAEAEPIVALVTDDARSPFASSTIAIEQALARPSSRGVELVIKWKVTGSPSPLVAYRVWLQAGAEKLDHGTLIVGRTNDGSINSSTSAKVVSSLPPDVTSVDVLLTPDPKAAERYMVEEIWGRPLEIKGVTLERYDVEAGR